MVRPNDPSGPDDGADEPEQRVRPDLQNLDRHILQSMAKRGWTLDQVREAAETGDAFPAVDLTAGRAPATRFVHPETGKSVVVNNLTGRVIHVGDVGFEYD